MSLDTVTSDAHSGLKAALKASLHGTPWQRCQFHLQQNAQEYVTKQHLKSKVATDIKVIFNADHRAHADERLKEFVRHYGESQPKLAAWAEENLPEGFAVFAFPEAHRRRLRTSNACENVNARSRSAPESSASSRARNHSSDSLPVFSSRSPKPGKPAKPTSP